MNMKSFLHIFLIFALFGTSFGAFSRIHASANITKTKYSFDIAGFDVATTTGSICVYPNDTGNTRVIGADDYGFRYSTLLIFNKDGKLIEAGGNIYSNSSGVTGSPQLTVKIPAGGFLVAFDSGAPQQLKDCFTTAMEGAMLYNATMSVIYDVQGSFNKQDKKLSISYDAPAQPSEKAVRFLFVGNSCTYFNGVPIKFKGLCKAAGIEIVADYCTYGSAYLSEFADETHERGKAMRQKLLNNKYDYVVLQDAGSATYSGTKESLKKILPLINDNGAKPLLYMRYSPDSNPDTRYTSAVNLYKSYTRVAEEDNIVCAPVAVSFIRCTNEYPDINLYADDNSHHSKEGSYLGACTFLYKFLGVSPVGNSYKAELSDEVAAALQKCAVEACDEKFDIGEEKVTYSENGKEYVNLALGKSYVPTGETYKDDKWTDTGSDGKPIGKLTDGFTAVSGSETSIGCYKGTETSITIDLGSVYPIKRAVSDLYGNTSWGIPDPGQAVVSVSISTDGVSFSDIGNAQMSDAKADGDWSSRVFSLTLSETVNARYVRVNYKIAGNFCWLSEIEVFGTDTSSTVSTDGSIGNSVENESLSDQSSTLKNNTNSFKWIYALAGAAVAAAATVYAVAKLKKKPAK